MEFSSSELKQDIQRFQRSGVIPRDGWSCPSIFSRWLSLWLHQVEQKGGILQYIWKNCWQSMLQVNLWYDFLEPRNQEIHNVMTQVSSFPRIESRWGLPFPYHVMSHLRSPQTRTLALRWRLKGAALAVWIPQGEVETFTDFLNMPGLNNCYSSLLDLSHRMEKQTVTSISGLPFINWDRLRVLPRWNSWGNPVRWA